MIYRLENKSGKGIYRFGYDAPNCMSKYNGTPKHPSPINDSLLAEALKDFTPDNESDVWAYPWSGKVVFGFSTPTQLLRWFYDERDYKALEDAGAFICVYEPPKEYIGHTQACFPSWYHLLWNPIKRYTPSEFLKEFGSKKETK